ncbi:MAG TPA: WecB/TagA/CpsF family glycosyltransferase [Candidatus Dormibacteraeota bacterium]|nr:WecB/TagA/CpsF family glycosyltransferase [Candidatus Dormibacteraeota bacterium]
MTIAARVNVLGVGVSAINMDQALAELAEWIMTQRRDYVCVCTVHSVMDCQRHSELKRIFNAAGMVTPDGMPLVWIGRSLYPHVTRVYGPDLMLAELEGSLRTGHRHFFYGGAPGVGKKLAEQMQARFSGLEIVGVMEPPFASLDELCTPEAAAVINAAQADVVWVGVGSPKQERWMARMRPMLDAPVLIGVGAAFDFHSGSVRQAPRWMQQSGLEWLFRLAVDPRRLWRRYVIDNPWFLWSVLMQRLGLRRYEL